VLIWVLYGVAFVVTAGRAATRFARLKTFQIEDYLIYFGLATLTALSVVITVMTPKFIATSELLKQSFIDPAVMAQPESIATLNDTSTGLKLLFR
jgi:hypothetical protein